MLNLIEAEAGPDQLDEVVLFVVEVNLHNPLLSLLTFAQLDCLGH